MAPYTQWLTEIAKKYDRYLDLISCSSSWIERPFFRMKEEFIFWHFVIQITLMLLDAYFFFFFHFQFLSVLGMLSFSFFFLYTKNPLLCTTLINFIAFRTLISVINQKESFAITYHYIVTYYFLIGKQPFLPYFMVSCKVPSIKI